MERNRAGGGSAVDHFCFTWVEIIFSPRVPRLLALKIRSYGHFMRGQLEVESVLRKPLILLPWSFLATPVPGKWAVHSPESEASCQAVIIHRVPRAVHPRDSDGFLSAIFMTYCITASWGEGKTGQAEKQQQQFVEIFVWGWMKNNLSVVCAAVFKKHFELDLIFTWFSETWQAWLISL